MITQDRSLVRVRFASLCETALAGDGKPCQTVYNTQVADWGTRSPIMVVTEAGTEWVQITNGGPFVPKAHYLAVHVFVLYASADGILPETASEALLSPIQVGLAGVVSSNRSYKTVEDGSLWAGIQYEGRSQVNPLKLKGREYRHESQILRFS